MTNLSFSYLISGGDRALITSVEKAEDDPHTGAEDLRQVAKNKHRVLYFGITCGFRYGNYYERYILTKVLFILNASVRPMWQAS
jgi:hypothetical protein